ncbi:MAG: CBS domain-containing protein [Caldilineaceae bacterium]|nr:CBS domain-containing protein [Caldilineaceae bacterium]
MSLESELREQKVAHLDLSSFSLAPSGSTVRAALDQLRSDGNTTCLVTENGKLMGIFTERDVLRRVVDAPGALDSSIDQVMTPAPTTISPDASAAEALRLMDEHHFRNLPVVDDDGVIVGNMTHQSVIAYLATRHPVEVLNLPPRPNQFPRKAEGG